MGRLPSGWEKVPAALREHIRETQGKSPWQAEASASPGGQGRLDQGAMFRIPGCVHESRGVEGHRQLQTGQTCVRGPRGGADGSCAFSALGGPWLLLGELGVRAGG